MNNINNKPWMPIDDESHLNGNCFRFSSWRNSLVHTSKKCVFDAEIIATKLDMINQNVIKTDSKRTRSKLLNETELQLIEKLLTFYSKSRKIKYKQGLNEVAGPFIFFLREERSIGEIYEIFSKFVNKFFFSFFDDEEFVTLQCFLRFFDLLIKYHDPGLAKLFKSYELPSEIFATPWFLTLFSSKTSLEIVYSLWDYIIQKNDPYFVLFLTVALVLDQKSSIEEGEPSVLPQLLSSLSFKNMNQLQSTIKFAESLRLRTPDSVILQIEEFVSNEKNSNGTANLLKKLECLEKIPSVLIDPFEIMRTLFPDSINCSNIHCKLIQTNLEKLSEESTLKFSRIIEESKHKTSQSRYGCPICDCSDSNAKKPLSYLMLDLRKDKSNGFLSKSHLVNGDWRKMIDDFIEMRGKYHFVLMDEEGKEDLTEIAMEFLNKGFNFVSIAIGGFSRLHLFHQIFDLHILDHEKQRCTYCSNKPLTTPSVGSDFLSQFIENVFKKSTTDSSKIEKPLKKANLKDFARKSPQKKNMSPIKHLKKNPPSPSRSPSSPPIISSCPPSSSPLASSTSLHPSSFLPTSSSSLPPPLNPSSLSHCPPFFSSSSSLLPFPVSLQFPSPTVLTTASSCSPPPSIFPPLSSSSSSSVSSLSHLLHVDDLKKRGKTSSIPLQENSLRDNRACLCEKGCKKSPSPNILMNDNAKNNKGKENCLKIEEKTPKNEKKTVFNVNLTNKEQKEKFFLYTLTKEQNEKNILNNNNNKNNKNQTENLICISQKDHTRQKNSLNSKSESEKIQLLNNFEEQKNQFLNLKTKKKNIKDPNKNEKKNLNSPKSKVPIQDLTIFLSQFEFFYFIGEEIVENGEKGREKESKGTNYKMKETIIVVCEGWIFYFKSSQILEKLLEIITFLKEKSQTDIPSEIFSVLNENEENFESTFSLKKLLPLKTIFKISSKKFNPNILSFYFKTPKRGDQEYKEYFTLLEDFTMKKLEQFSLEKRLYRFFSDWHLNEKNPKEEFKFLFFNSSVNDTKNCIRRIQKAYTQITSSW